MKNKQLLKEDFIENALMIAGFVPVIGEIADIILIIYYIYQGKYLYAGLMLIALIPTVGDFIAKPFIYLLKSKKVTNIALKNGDDFYKFLSSNPKAMDMYSRLGNHINNPLIGKTINQVEKVPKIGANAASGMRESIKQHANILERIFRKPIDISKSIGKEIVKAKPSILKTAIGQGPVSQGIKKYFRGDRLAKYVEKNGAVPSNWVSYWYNIVYKGRRDRKAYIKKFITANNLLAFFGIPSFSAFENKMENDEAFRTRIANDPTMSDLIGRITDKEDLDEINNSLGISNRKKSGFEKFGQMMGIGLLKKLAQNLT
jgi:hypothetical protein